MTIESQKTANFDINFEKTIWKAFVQSKISLKLSRATIWCHTWLESCPSQLCPRAAYFNQYVHCEVCIIENQEIKFKKKNCLKTELWISIAFFSHFIIMRVKAEGFREGSRN